MEIEEGVLRKTHRKKMRRTGEGRRERRSI